MTKSRADKLRDAEVLIQIAGDLIKEAVVVEVADELGDSLQQKIDVTID